jgi:hypothetical protein
MLYHKYGTRAPPITISNAVSSNLPCTTEIIIKTANAIKDTPLDKPSIPSVSFKEKVDATKTKTKKGINHNPKSANPLKGTNMEVHSSLK